MEDLKHTKEIGSYLQGHPDVQKTPGIEAGTGSLGQGFPVAWAWPLGLGLDRLDGRTYVLVGDGVPGRQVMGGGRPWQPRQRRDNQRPITWWPLWTGTGCRPTEGSKFDTGISWPSF